MNAPKYRSETRGHGEPQTWLVRSLDVWGHAPGGEDCECGEDDSPDAERCEGFSVNQSFGAGKIVVHTIRHVHNVGTPQEFISDACEDADLLIRLVENGYLKASAVNAGLVEIEDRSDGTFLEVNATDDGEPLYVLEKEEIDAS